VWATTLIILPRCGPQRAKIIGVAGINTEKQFSTLLPTTRKMIGVVATTWKIFPRSGQQRRKTFSVVGNNAEELPQRRTK
jgi:hypothetical protein